MNTPDISALARAALAIVSLAVALGQYPRLERWARVQAAEALEWKEPLPYFFANPKQSAGHPGIIRHSHPSGGTSR
jgi:hypothetical protein